MPDEVARGFAEATRSVAAGPGATSGSSAPPRTGEPAVSRAAELPADAGSGLWLRRFGAARSVAVPVRRRLGARSSGVVSVALARRRPTTPVVAAAIGAEARGLGRIVLTR